MPNAVLPRVRTTICYCTNKLDGTCLWGPSSVCHQPLRIHNGTSSKSSLLGCGEQWAASTDKRLHFSFPNSGIRGGDNQWKCSICFMSTAEHTTEDNHFFLSSPPPSSILPIMLAHCHPLAVSAGKLSGRVQTARGEEMHLHLHVSHHFCTNLHLVLQTIGGLLLKTPKKVIRTLGFFVYFPFS